MVPANGKRQQDQPAQGFGSGKAISKPRAARSGDNAAESGSDRHGFAGGARKKFPAALARTLEPGTPPEIFCESLLSGGRRPQDVSWRADYC
jgi:hypothetical protein